MFKSVTLFSSVPSLTSFKFEHKVRTSFSKRFVFNFNLTNAEQWERLSVCKLAATMSTDCRLSHPAKKGYPAHTYWAHVNLTCRTYRSFLTWLVLNIIYHSSQSKSQAFDKSASGIMHHKTLVSESFTTFPLCPFILIFLSPSVEDVINTSSITNVE